MLYIGKEMQAETVAFARRLGSDGRILVVKSGTEPILRRELRERNLGQWIK